MPGYSTCMALGHCLCRGIQPAWPWVIVYAGIFNLHGLGSLFMPGYSTFMALGHCLCQGIQPSWPWVIVHTGVFNLHGLGSLFIPGYSTCMIWHNITATWPKTQHWPLISSVQQGPKCYGVNNTFGKTVHSKDCASSTVFILRVFNNVIPVADVEWRRKVVVNRIRK
jgi:hypothetical protein